MMVTTSAAFRTSGMYASSKMRWMRSRKCLPKTVSGSSGIDGVPVVPSFGITSLIHCAGIPSMPGVLRLLELRTISHISGQKIGSSFLCSESSCLSLGLDSIKRGPHTALCNGPSRPHSLRDFLSSALLYGRLV